MRCVRQLDVEQYRGHLVRPGMFPLIPGHEPLGVIEEVGERAAQRWGVSVGDRVAVEILRLCHSCDHCLTGRYMSCPEPRRRVRHDAAVALALAVGWVRRLPVPAPVGDPAQGPGDLPPEIAVMFNPLGAGVRWAAMLGEVSPATPC